MRIQGNLLEEEILVEEDECMLLEKKSYVGNYNKYMKKGKEMKRLFDNTDKETEGKRGGAGGG